MSATHEFLISLKLLHGRDYDEEIIKDAVLDAIQAMEADLHKRLFKTVDFALHVVNREKEPNP